MKQYLKNNTIICVDDDQDILDTYQIGLSLKEGQDTDVEDAFSRWKLRKGKSCKIPNRTIEGNEDFESYNRYNVLTAASGKEAIEIVKEEVSGGRRIAVGFFDMKMPGGIDGLETIKKVRAIDPLILCAVVTAYTDHSISKIGQIFDNKDDWIYFNKPFSIYELEQAAIFLMNSWNRRRREEDHLSVIEKSREGLQYILEALLKLNNIPPLTMGPLIRGVLEQLTGLIGSSSGFMVLFGKDNEIIFVAGNGEYLSISLKNIEDIINKEQIINKSMIDKDIVVSGRKCSVPLYKDDKILGIIYLIHNSVTLKYQKDLLRIFSMQLANLIKNSTRYKDLKDENRSLYWDLL